MRSVIKKLGNSLNSIRAPGGIRTRDLWLFEGIIPSQRFLLPDRQVSNEAKATGAFYNFFILTHLHPLKLLF